jgi:hypothetical protein
MKSILTFQKITIMLLWIAFLIGCGEDRPSQPGSISGTVSLKCSGETRALVEHKVELYNSEHHFVDYTDENGFYRIENVPLGKYTLECIPPSNGSGDGNKRFTVSIQEGEETKQDVIFSEPPPPSQFMPLAVGNWWEYTVTGKKDEISRRIEVTNTTDISGKTFYVLTVTGKDPSGNSLPVWTMFCLNEDGTLKKLLDGNLYTVIPDDAKVRQSWPGTTLTFVKMPTPVEFGGEFQVKFGGEFQEATQISQHQYILGFTYDCKEAYIKGVGLVESEYSGSGYTAGGIYVAVEHHYKLLNYYVNNCVYEVEENKNVKNIALNAKVEVSSTFNDKYVGENAIDGNNDQTNPDTRWLSGKNPPHWLILDFGKPMTIVKVNLYFSVYQGTPWGSVGYVIQYEKDGKWVDIPGTQVKNGKREDITKKFDISPPISARRLRFYCTDGCSYDTTWGNIVRLSEIEILSETKKG